MFMFRPENSRACDSSPVRREMELALAEMKWDLNESRSESSSVPSEMRGFREERAAEQEAAMRVVGNAEKSPHRSSSSEGPRPRSRAMRRTSRQEQVRRFVGSG